MAMQLCQHLHIEPRATVNTYRLVIVLDKGIALGTLGLRIQWQVKAACMVER